MRSRRSIGAVLTAAAMLSTQLTTAGRARADDDGPVVNLGNPKPTRNTAVPYPPASPRVLPPADAAYEYRRPTPYPTLPWIVTQLIPSPAVAIGSVHRTGTDGVQQDNTQVAFGMRWEVTPVLWSWGVNRHASRWRFFVVDPLARNSGSLELNGTVEYFFGHVDRFLVRPGVRATFPILQRGEYLSASIGTSTYAYNNVEHVAYDFGVNALFGILGLQFSYAPAHAPLSYIGTFRIRYF